jgi:translation initiation factor 1
MQNKNKNRSGIVYSTNENFEYQLDNQFEQPETLSPENQKLKVFEDSKQRKGKTVTIINGFIGKEEDLKELEKILKNKCGTGGSSKDGEIIIQGKLSEKIKSILKSLNYNIKN